MGRPRSTEAQKLSVIGNKKRSFDELNGLKLYDSIRGTPYSIFVRAISPTNLRIGSSMRF